MWDDENLLASFGLLIYYEIKISQKMHFDYLTFMLKKSTT